jgi:hypothetical protein
MILCDRVMVYSNYACHHTMMINITDSHGSMAGTQHGSLEQKHMFIKMQRRKQFSNGPKQAHINLHITNTCSGSSLRNLQKFYNAYFFK